MVILGGMVILLVGLSIKRALTWQPKFSPTPLPTSTPTPQAMPSLRPIPDDENIENLYEVPTNLQPKPTTCSTCGAPSAAEPTCSVHADVFEGAAPLSVKLTYFAHNYDPNVSVTGIQWDYDGNNTWDTHMGYDNAEVTHIFNAVGTYRVRMKVGFSDGSETEVCTTEIKAK